MSSDSQQLDVRAGTTKVLVLTYTPLARSPRVLKQVDALRGHHDVTTAGFGPSPFGDVRHVALPSGSPIRWGLVGRALNALLLLLRLHPLVSALRARDRVALAALSRDSWDLVFAHDLPTLNVALRLKPRRGVVLDLHEYAPTENAHSRRWRLFIAPYVRWELRTRARKAVVVVAVAEGIRQKYREEFGFDCLVVPNMTPYQELDPGAVQLPIRLVHSGVASPDRGIDQIILGVRRSTADVTLDLYLVQDAAGTLDSLREMADGESRIAFHEPASYDDLVRTLNARDVGIHLLPPVNFNNLMALPNKLFDFVQARLGVIVGPSPEMARIVREHGLGDVLVDFDADTLARRLDSLTTREVGEWKLASHRSARALSSESYRKVWLDVVSRITAQTR